MTDTIYDGPTTDTEKLSLKDQKETCEPKILKTKWNISFEMCTKNKAEKFI